MLIVLAMTHLLRQFAYTLCSGREARRAGPSMPCATWPASCARLARSIASMARPSRSSPSALYRYTLADFDWLTPLPEPSVHPRRKEQDGPQASGTGTSDQPDLVAVIEAYGGTLTQKSAQEWHGAHPTHGSSTGINLDCNLAQQLWHCWRHGTGGDALSLIAVCEGLVACEDVEAGCLAWRALPPGPGHRPDPFWLGTPDDRTVPLSHIRVALLPWLVLYLKEHPMSTPVTMTIEPNGTLRYDCGHEIAVRVALHQRNGGKTYPVEVLHQDTALASTDCDLRNLHAIESLYKYVNTVHKLDDWLSILTAVAKALPAKARTPWTPVGQPLSAYTISRREYLWYPWLLKGEPCSIEGDPNVGKTAVLIKLLAHLTSGTRFPTLCADQPEEDFEPCTVVLFTNEDSPAKTLHPRLVLNGGNADRVDFMQGKKDPDTGHVLPLTLQDLDVIEQLLTAHTPAMLCFRPDPELLWPACRHESGQRYQPRPGRRRQPLRRAWLYAPLCAPQRQNPAQPKRSMRPWARSTSPAICARC